MIPGRDLSDDGVPLSALCRTTPSRRREVVTFAVIRARRAALAKVVCAEYRRGERVEDIARDHGVSDTKVYLMLRAAGLRRGRRR